MNIIQLQINISYSNKRYGIARLSHHITSHHGTSRHVPFRNSLRNNCLLPAFLRLRVLRTLPPECAAVRLEITMVGYWWWYWWCCWYWYWWWCGGGGKLGVGGIKNHHHHHIIITTSHHHHITTQQHNIITTTHHYHRYVPNSTTDSAKGRAEAQKCNP